MISNITIGVSTTRKFMSRVIRWITKSPVSHAWVAFDDPSIGVRMVLQAEAWGVELRPWDRWKKNNIPKAEFSVVHSSSSLHLRRMIQEDLGAKYDWRSAFLVGFKRWFNKWIMSNFSLNPSRTPGRLMCAELVAVYLSKLMWDRKDHVNVEVVSPLELYQQACQSSCLEMKWRLEDMPRE